MKLLDTYFNITESIVAEDNLQGRFKVELIESHPVYEGHFPGEPVCPGVCSMQMVKECAMQLCNKELVFSYVKQYRLLSVMSPQKNREIEINIELSPSVKDDLAEFYKIKASVCALDNPELKYLDINGELTPAK
ncbi:MAG: hypothetical protein IKD16_02175 [Bacteroidales bacterium]|nr:hypothetical protein [Bacteroidales bacterium]